MTDLTNIPTSSLISELRHRGYLEYASMSSAVSLEEINFHGNDQGYIAAIHRELAERLGLFLLDSGNWPIEVKEDNKLEQRVYKFVVPVLRYTVK